LASDNISQRVSGQGVDAAEEMGRWIWEATSESERRKKIKKLNLKYCVLAYKQSN